MKPFVRNQFDAAESCFDLVENVKNHLSVTVPNQSMSVKEIITRYAAGGVIPVIQKDLRFGEEPDPCANPAFDLVDAEALLTRGEEAARAEESARKQAAESKRKADFEAAVQAEADKRSANNEAQKVAE